MKPEQITKLKKKREDVIYSPLQLLPW